MTIETLETKADEDRRRKIIALLQELFQLVDEPRSSAPTENRCDDLVDEDGEKAKVDEIDHQYREALRERMREPRIVRNITLALLQIMSPEEGEETALLQGFWSEGIPSITLSNGTCISSGEALATCCKFVLSQLFKGDVAFEENLTILTEHFRKFRGSEVLEAIRDYGRCIDAHMEQKEDSPFIKIVNDKINAFRDLLPNANTNRLLNAMNTVLLSPARARGGESDFTPIEESDFTPIEHVIFGSHYSLPFDILNAYFEGELTYKDPAVTGI